jgi:anaerobic selenocysteine-containing dehydrogenase
MTSMAEEVIRTTCSYCSTGCNLEAHLQDGKLASLRPAADYPVNLGKSCPKGFHLLTPFQSPDRALTPMLRRERGGPLEPVDWGTAISTFVSRFKGILEKHGPESVAFLSSGQIPTEEMAFLGALAKFGMGLVHCDGNTRQCMATAAVAYKQAFGFDAPPLSYKDFEESDLLIFVGANPVIAHPIMWNRVKMNPRNPTIVVIDPRRTKTAEAASIHLAINPKSDLTLLYALANILIQEGWIDRGFIERSTEGFEEFRVHVSSFSLEMAAAETGLQSSAILDLARRIHESKAASFWWTMGVNQSHQAVRTAQGIINLALITGHIGRPGTGANSITGQANAMGSRLYSNTTSLMGGYDFLNESHRRHVAGILGIDPEAIPRQNSWPYHRILQGVKEGVIKGLWILATNPVHSWIDKSSMPEVFGRLELLVVQDLYGSTDTAQLADLFLPGAGSGEKNGTFINSERRIGIVQKILDPPGQALPDFEIFRRIAQAWGCGPMFREWTSPEAVFQILKRLSASQPCDITGISDYSMLLAKGGIQWPFPAGSDPRDATAARRLFADGRFFTASGKARLHYEDIAPLPEAPDAQFPLILLTGRGSVAQWHTQTRTNKVKMLRNLYPAQVYVQVNPRDAAALGIGDGDPVKVSSRRGEVEAQTTLTEEVRPGQVFMAMHYFETNQLTFPAFDPYSAEPSYKLAAVRLARR